MGTIPFKPFGVDFRSTVIGTMEQNIAIYLKSQDCLTNFVDLFQKETTAHKTRSIDKVSFVPSDESMVYRNKTRSSLVINIKIPENGLVDHATNMKICTMMQKYAQYSCFEEVFFRLQYNDNEFNLQPKHRASPKRSKTQLQKFFEPLSRLLQKGSGLPLIEDVQPLAMIYFYFEKTQFELPKLKQELQRIVRNADLVTILDVSDDAYGTILLSLSEKDALTIMRQLQASDQVVKYYVLPRLCSYGTDITLSIKTVIPFFCAWFKLCWVALFLLMQCYMFLFDWWRAVIIKNTLVQFTRRIALLFAKGEGGAIFKYQKSCVMVVKLVDEHIMRSSHVEVYSGSCFGSLNQGSFYTYDETKESRFRCAVKATWHWLCMSPSSLFTFTFLLAGFTFMMFFPFKTFTNYINLISEFSTIEDVFTVTFWLRSLINYPLMTLLLAMVFNKYFVILPEYHYSKKIAQSFPWIPSANSAPTKVTVSKELKLKNDPWWFNITAICLISSAFGVMFVTVPVIFILAKVLQGLLIMMNGFTNIKNYTR